MTKLRQFARMRQYGILKATIEYSGGGDDGAVDGCVIEWKEGAKKKLPKNFETEVSKILEDFAWEAVASSYMDGWYNNDGGQGNVEIDFTKNPPIVEIDHNQNFTESQNYHYKIEADLL